MNAIKIVFLLVYSTACTTLRTSDAFAWMNDVVTETIATEMLDHICTNRTPKLHQKILQATHNNDFSAIQTLYHTNQLFNAQDPSTKLFAIEIAAQHNNAEAVHYFLKTMTFEDMNKIEQYFKDELSDGNLYQTIYSRVTLLMCIIFKSPETVALFFKKSRAKTGKWATFHILSIEISNITANNLAYALNMLQHANKRIKSRLNRYANMAIGRGSIPHLLTILTYLKKTKSCNYLNYSNPLSGNKNTLQYLIWKKFDESHTLETMKLLLDYGATITMPHHNTDDFDDKTYHNHPDLISTLHTALQHPSQAVLKLIFELTEEKLSKPINITSCLAYTLTQNSYNYETISYLFAKGAIIDTSIEKYITYICLNTSTTEKILQLFFDKGLSFKNMRPEEMQEFIQQCLTKLSDKKLALLCENGLPYLGETFYANTLIRHLMALLFIQKEPENPLRSFKKYCNLFCWKNNDAQKLLSYLYQALPHHINTAVACTFQFQDELYRFTKEDAKNDPSQDFVWPCDVAFEYEQ